MKLIFEADDGYGNDGAEHSQFSCWVHGDGSLMVQVPSDGLAPFLSESQVLPFIDAVRRAYAERYDKKTARRAVATKETYHDQTSKRM